MSSEVDDVEDEEGISKVCMDGTFSFINFVISIKMHAKFIFLRYTGRWWLGSDKEDDSIV